MAEPIFTATRVSLLFLAIESSCRNGLHPTAALPSCQSFPSCLVGTEPLRACVTFFAGDSYIVRAKMATRRPVRKGSAKDVGEGVRLGTEQSAGERVLVEAAQSDPAKFEVLYKLHFERVYAFVASRVRERSTAEDVTSEVFHKALASLPSYEWRGGPFFGGLLLISADSLICQSKPPRRDVPPPPHPPGPAAAPDPRAYSHRG